MGAPTRELYINDEGFQFQFNGPLQKIQLATGEILHVQLQSSNPPLVRIGAKRQDLVAGQVMLSVSDTDFVQIFLDAKPQRYFISSLDFSMPLLCLFYCTPLINILLLKIISKKTCISCVRKRTLTA